MSLNNKEIISMLKLVDESNYGFLSLEDKDFELMVIKKEMNLTDIKDIINGRENNNGQSKLVDEVLVQSNIQTNPSPVTQESKKDENKQIDNGNPLINENTYVIHAPMVGTFFSKPSPEEATYVQVGDSIEEGDTVCLIEVMKLFNSVPATENGKIVEILVEDGELVEYNQPLFVVEKSSVGSTK